MAQPSSKHKFSFANVEYEVFSPERHGNNWTLVLTAKSVQLGGVVVFQKARVITKDGEAWEVSYPMGFDQYVTLPTGVKVKVRFNMGNLPVGVKEFARVEFYISSYSDSHLDIDDVVVR